jgi:hypothetical protein
MKFISYCFQTFSPAVSKFLVVTGLSLSFASCQWGDQVDALVQPNPDDFTAQYSDSSTVKFSTLVVDSMMTGSASRQLIGRYVDPFLGKIHAASFIQPGITDSGISFPETAVYDSLVLSLRYDGYYYGDTTKAMNVTVHTLQQDMMEKNAYYNNDFTPYDATPIGKARFFPNPRPRAGTQADPGAGRVDLRIKLSDELGKKIFDMGRTNQITNSAMWINLLKGLAIIPATEDNGAVVGFITGRTSLRLYHHSPAAVEGIAKDSLSVDLVGVYNQTGGDRKGTILSKLPNTYRVALPSEQTGNMSFVQAGTGVMTRIDFPYIRQYKNQNYTFANSARLIIDPLRNSVSSSFYLPSTLNVYLCDKNNDYLYSGNTPIELTGISGGAVTAQLVNDYVNDRQYYVLDVSQYIQQILMSESEQNYGLLLRTSTFTASNGGLTDVNTEFSKSFTRVVFGDQSNTNGRVKLEIKYTSIKTQ